MKDYYSSTEDICMDATGKMTENKALMKLKNTFWVSKEVYETKIRVLRVVYFALGIIFGLFIVLLILFKLQGSL